ncbi:helix-turn-helix domain-containing protein [Dawidia soli]|uniref:Helix-turn-helix domain-containing protein n=1 Tax=Dawidia soli TaxID=2782352 RepID=A0AAP2D620_9BACT|nr:helix-turn-helix domain-containing protein [Dawidia soli]MBT1685983.1 helix-turn-helix domain-containing protein [Dawidia soli]
MSPLPVSDKDFLREITALIEENIADEQFGVSELAEKMNMSRSNLLRKVKKHTDSPVNQLIREVRLKRGMELLRTTGLNVSEVSDQVGFGSVSYFIKCFREYYGYPPGEAGKRVLEPEAEGAVAETAVPVRTTRWPIRLRWGAAALVVLVALVLVGYYVWRGRDAKPLPEKSIAVLPFKNDSGDSTNLYLINGLMESTLNNLQKIQDLRVISRTSSEKYRNTAKSIPEMARELDVNYFIEGSGQKIGDRILLNIQLIEGTTDRHLWSRRYEREAKDIFALQQEIAHNIAEEIEAIITPEEVKQIEKIPTDDLEAYNEYMEGRELLYDASTEALQRSIVLFQRAIKRDPHFAQAYADAAVAYYYLDLFQINKKYGKEISEYADKALLYDEKSAESLIAKALYFMHKKEYKEAAPYLEKALDYNPNSGIVAHFLSELYNGYLPNAAKYIEYALLGVRIDGNSGDSSTVSYKYLHLSNALMQAGFIDEALEYIDKSLAYKADNPFSGYLRVYILYAKNEDVGGTCEALVKEFRKDTTNFIMMQEIGKMYYFMRNYAESYKYYKRYLAIVEEKELDIFKHENLKIGIVLQKMGQPEKGQRYIDAFERYVKTDSSIYRHANLAGYYSYLGDAPKAIEHMKLFAREKDYQYWILFFTIDPIADSVKDLPEFKKAMQQVRDRFWENHRKVRATLEEKGLL